MSGRKATTRRPINATTSPDLPPPEGEPFSSRQKITIEISSSPEPDFPPPHSRRASVGAPPRSGKSLQVQIVIASSSSKSDGPTPSRRGQRSSAKALTFAPRAPRDIIEISSDEETLPQINKRARKQGHASGPLTLARAQKKRGEEEPGHGGKGKARAAQERPSLQPRKGAVGQERSRIDKRKRPTEDNPLQHRTPAFNPDHWSYSVQDLDPIQLEALAIVANAEAGLEVGQAESSLTHHQADEDQGGPSSTTVWYHSRQEGESLLDRDGDTIMIDATHAPTLRPPTPIGQDPIVGAILDLKPDLDPTYVRDLVKTYAPDHGPQTVDLVLEVIFSGTTTEHEDPDVSKADSLVGGGTLQQQLGGLDAANQDPVLECQCCFEEHNSIRMVHCPQGHPFCLSCLRRYAEERLGTQDPDLLCMHQDGCRVPFETLQLERALPENMISLLQRTQQRQELKRAKLEGFEECPFCEWGCVIDIPIAESTTFICGNDGICGKISCRLCRREHEPTKPCEEVDSEKSTRLAMEEAMSMAVIRTCPNCPQVSFVKEEGCNKMVCPECRSYSCYSCKAQIQGYEHFYPNDPLSRCILFDDDEVNFDIPERHPNDEHDDAHQEAANQDL